MSGRLRSLLTEIHDKFVDTNDDVSQSNKSLHSVTARLNDWSQLQHSLEVRTSLCVAVSVCLVQFSVGQSSSLSC